MDASNGAGRGCGVERAMKKAIFWGTLAAGAVAAYLMVKRGAPLTEVVTRTLRNPFGALGSELQSAITGKTKSLTA